MQKIQENHIFLGMQRDLSVSKHPIQFLYDARNIRLTAREGDTLMSITNEKGTSDTSVTVDGTYLGHCLLNAYLVVFSTVVMWDEEHENIISQEDIINRLDLSEDIPAKVELFRGNLGFDEEHPIKAIGSYETSAIQKVYWVDNKNQSRLINITAESFVETWNSSRSYQENLGYTTKSFDFIQELLLEEEITVQKLVNSSGEFAPGVIQYSFTYYNKYGQESNIFYTTPLYYISHFDRGGSPEEKISNAFCINIKGLDTKFDFLRIYSIQRTSIDATPIVKRVQDINLRELTGTSTSFIDDGVSGNTVDPTELLYKGGEEVRANTIEQKDGTLFFGGIKINRESLDSIQDSFDALADSTKQGWFTTNHTRTIKPLMVSSSDYVYANQLTAKDADGNTVPCAGFKKGDTYRCGIQFQYKNGKWGEPLFITDVKVTGKPSYTEGSTPTVTLPCLKAVIPATYITTAYDKGYRRVRPVVVLPEVQDRNIVCQGVVNPTLTTDKHLSDNNPTAQSSWFFRPLMNDYMHGQAVAPISGSNATLPYCHRNIEDYKPDSNKTVFDPTATATNIRRVEIEGDFKDVNKFKVYTNLWTMHSPDVEFDDHIAVMDFNGLGGQMVGSVRFDKTLADIDIQTESPTVGSIGSGFVHHPFNTSGPYGIVSGLFYDDAVVDDDVLDTGRIGAYPNPKQSAKWMVYPWHGTGSLNNDTNRPADKGTPSAILKKKVISNLRFTSTSLNDSTSHQSIRNMQLFSSDEVSIVKLNSKIYEGNIDTSLMPDFADGTYFALNGMISKGITPVGGYHESTGGEEFPDTETPFISEAWFKTWSMDPINPEQEGLRMLNTCSDDNKLNWAWMGPDIGETYVDLIMKKLPVRMKYKSTPHLVLESNISLTENQKLPIIEITQQPVTIFGGTSKDALMANTWIPCGEPVSIYSSSDATIEYSYGDTYFQRYDCLKTYAFTKEDLNQIVEIGSFMLETHVNIDGRYDRNRGQMNNLNMSPQNFNLINPVYTQRDNFFSYKILDEDFYKDTDYPNQITWSKEKNAGAETDLWTNVTLASTYDMDGSKGKVEELVTYKDQIYCFQDKGVSNILFNSRVQIPASDGVPIEISNSYKVDGYRYISDGIGCDDKRLVKKTPAGIYFIDSVGSHLFHISEQGMFDLSEQCNMTTWFKDNAGTIERLAYDDINHDVYAVQENQAICFSEKLNQFTGFYDYGGINLIETYDHHVFTLKNSGLWKMFEGEYGQFFGENKLWGITFISNGLSDNLVAKDKIFTNLEFRACVDTDGELDAETGRFTPILPFNFMETWNEYQHGMATFVHRNGHNQFQHHTRDGIGNLKRKFRIWRCDIPRDNYRGISVFDATFDTTFRSGSRHSIDRMRNSWLYISLRRNAADWDEALKKTEIHDMMVTYFINKQ